MDLLASQATALADRQGQPVEVAVGETKQVAFNIQIEAGIAVDLGDIQIPLELAHVSGEITRVENVIIPALKALVKLDEDHPYAGCAVFQLSSGNLCGVAIERYSGEVRLINITVKDRLLNKIYRRRLR